MQIISGMYKGRKLHLPSNARPTQNRARIALFNMLESGIISPGDNFIVWDAFAGSGAFGLECLSRYPGATVIFTDAANDSISTVRANLAMLNTGARGRAVQIDAGAAIATHGAAADLIFLDPPYADAALGAAIVKKLAVATKKNAVLIWEQDAQNFTLPDDKAWEILRDKQYGRARFLILRRRGE